MSEEHATKCLNCETELHGKFCYACGQKVHEPHERTLKYFIFQFFGSAFFLENNFLKNLWKLLTKPGLQTHDYIEGRRKRWMTPFSIFLLINLVYFIVSPLSDFSLSLDNQVRLQLHSPIAKKLVDNRLKDRNITFKDYSKAYQSQSDALTKTLIILNAPISAVFFMLWFYRRKMFYVDHFIYFVHVYAFLLLSAILMWGLAWLMFVLNLLNESAPGLFFFMLMLSIFYYFTVSIKRVYRQRSFRLLFSVVFSFAVLFGTHMVYRFILFMTTFWTT